jgi:glutamate/tyrosine decarboxylase-like PLP-dependent enzyme
MALARDHAIPRENWGLGVAYVSDQRHSSVAKGLRILGF